MCETRASSGFVKTNFDKLNYHICFKPGSKARSGGTVVAVKKNYGSLLNVTSCNNPGIVAAKLKFRGLNLRVIAAYGPQESVFIDERKKFFEDLSVEIENASISGDYPVVLGDLNGKIKQLNGITTSASSNGELIVNMMNNYHLKAMNHHPSCVGMWTHENRKSGDPLEKSILDYVLVNDKLYQTAVDIQIDESLLFTPFYVKNKNTTKQTKQFTDHNAISVTFKINLLNDESNTAKRAQNGWKITEKGLKKFQEITESGESFFESKSIPLQFQYDQFEKALNEKMSQCFLKKKNKPLPDLQTESWYRKFTSYLLKIAKTGKVQKKVSKHLLDHLSVLNEQKTQKKRADRIKAVVDTLSPDDCFNPNGFWKLKKSLNPKASESSSVIDGGVEVFSDEAIVEAYRKEFVSRLSPREISPDLKNFQELSNTLVEQLIAYHAENQSLPPYSPEELEKAINSFKNKKRKATGTDLLPAEILCHGGNWIFSNVLGLCNRIKETVSVPSQFNNLSITTLHKKGSQKLLINKRGIFLSIIMSKLNERLVKNRIEKNLDTVNILQAGARSERSPADSHFLIRGIIDHAKYVNKPVYLSMYDYRQCFDSLWLQDSILSLWKLGVDNEMLSLIWKLNQEASIVVKTPHGTSEPFTIYAFVKQGSVLGSNLCSSSTGEFCDETSGGGVNIGSLNIKSSLFVDDTTTIDGNCQDSSDSHRQIVLFARKKRLTFSHEKCIVLHLTTTVHR